MLEVGGWGQEKIIGNFLLVGVIKGSFQKHLKGVSKGKSCS